MLRAHSTNWLTNTEPLFPGHPRCFQFIFFEREKQRLTNFQLAAASSSLSWPMFQVSKKKGAVFREPLWADNFR